MNREFSIKLAERVGTMFLFVFVSTYAAGAVSLVFHTSTPLSVAQRATVAAIAAVVQLLLGTLVAPHVGNPNSPSLLPNSILKRFGGAASAPQVVVSVDDVVKAALAELAKKYPEAKTIESAAVTAGVLADKVAAH